MKTKSAAFSNWSLTSWMDNAYIQKYANGDTFYTLTNPDLGNFVSVFNGGYSEQNMMVLFETMPELFFVVNTIATRVMTGIYSLQDKDGNVIEDNELWNQIIKKPNWQYSFHSFGWHYEAYKLLTGNAYGFTYIPGMMSSLDDSKFKPTSKNIKAIHMLPSHYVWMEMKQPRPSHLMCLSSEDYIDHYNYNCGYPIPHIPPRFVTHIIHKKMGNLTDMVTNKGVSPLKAAERPLSNLVAVYTSRNVLQVQGGPRGAIVSRKSDGSGQVPLSPDEKEAVTNDVMRRHGTQRGQSPIIITDQPIDYIKMGATIAEMEPFKETRADLEAMCLIMNIPISLTADAKFSNLDISERNLYENVIFGEAHAFCSFLTELCRFDELGYTVKVNFDHITCLQDDAAKKAQAFNYNTQAATQLYDDGHITRNQLLNVVGEEPIEGGDDYISDEERLYNTTRNAPGSNPVAATSIDGQVDPEEGDEEQDKPKSFNSKLKAPKLFGNKKLNRKKLNFFNYGTP